MINEEFYGKINYYGYDGKIGETVKYNDKKKFDKEIYDSNEIGIPIGTMIYRENNMRTAEITEYLVEKKLDRAEDIYEEYMSYPRSREDTRLIGLAYINNLYNINSMYKVSVTGLNEHIKGIVRDTMEELNIPSKEVSKYIDRHNKKELTL